MAMIGEANGADMRTISLIHVTRIITVVTIMPFYFRFFEGKTIVTTFLNNASIAPLGGTEAIILLSCGFSGLALGKFLRIPAYPLVGPMVASLVVHLLGFSHSAPPTQLIAAAQIIIGISIGCRLSGLTFSTIHWTLLAGLGASLMMTCAALFAAVGFAQFLEVDSYALMLALAPGGVSEMGLIALSLGVSIAYVSSMQIIRIFMIVIASPLVFHLVMRRHK